VNEFRRSVGVGKAQRARGRKTPAGGGRGSSLAASTNTFAKDGVSGSSY
jgi:hypothetical protein